MGLLQKGIETYNAMESRAGVLTAGEEPLAPICHICARAAIEISLDKDGKFVQAQKTDQKIIIPVTEKSAGRTSAPEPHPLCDQVGYLCGTDKKKRKQYLEQLQRWRDNSTKGKAKLSAVYTYVESGTMLNDLLEAGLIALDEKGRVKNEKDLICWRVAGLGDRDSAVWTDRELQEGYAEYYLLGLNQNEYVISMISGERETPASQHLKGVFSLAGNAKIISSNDSTNFTYRGRFLSSEEALSIGYVDSQKSHNALKWIITNQGVVIGNRVFVCWNPEGNRIPQPLLPILKQNELKRVPTEYKRDLQKIILGFKNSLPQGSEVVIASLEAATSGRLAVTYYGELQGSDFLDRLKYWDETCCWFDNRWGTSSPSLRDIVRYAFGVQRGSEEKANVEVDDGIMQQQMQHLLVSRIEKAAFPADIMRALVQNNSRPGSYNSRNRERLLFITCAVIRKYRSDRFKEEWDMALEPEKKDRSYQYGRLLAILEKAERDTYETGKERDPNAIRMQSVFVQRPAYATKIIIDQLKNAYYPRLNPGQKAYYEKLIGEVMLILSEFDDTEYNKPLGETYLLGYYLQKNALYTKKETKQEEDE